MYKGYISLLDTVLPLNACLIKMARKCGKPNCKCVKRGELHPYYGIKYRLKIDDKVSQKVIYVKADEVDEIKRELYSEKGEALLRRDDYYIHTIGKMYPNLYGKAIHIKAYEEFGKHKNTSDSSLTAN